MEIKKLDNEKPRVRKRKMLYMGKMKTCWSKLLERKPSDVWLAYHHKHKFSFIIIKCECSKRKNPRLFLTMAVSSKEAYERAMDLIDEKDGLTLEELHKKYYYPWSE